MDIPKRKMILLTILYVNEKRLGLGVKYIDLRDRNIAASSLGTQSTRTQPGLKRDTISKEPTT